MISLETFSEENRDRDIGHSRYRICRQQQHPYNWYIHEMWNEYPDGNWWAIGNGFFTDSLQKVIDSINSLSREKEVAGVRQGSRARHAKE